MESLVSAYTERAGCNTVFLKFMGCAVLNWPARKNINEPRIASYMIPIFVSVLIGNVALGICAMFWPFERKCTFPELSKINPQPTFS